MTVSDRPRPQHRAVRRPFPEVHPDRAIPVRQIGVLPHPRSSGRHFPGRPSTGVVLSVIIFQPKDAVFLQSPQKSKMKPISV